MLAIEIKSTKNINKYNCDLIIVPTPYSSNSSRIDVDFNTLDVDKKLCLSVDKIIEEDEIESLKQYLKDSLNWNVDYYLFSDLSVYYILTSYGIKNKFIFNAKTLNCSVNDIKCYNELGISCLVSTELTNTDVINISNIQNNAFLVYGYSNIFYSKRKLISLYSDYKNIHIDLNKQYYVIEETRKEKYPICENENGTFIYTPYCYFLFNELNELNKNNIFIINSFNLEEDDLVKIGDIYQETLKDGAKVENLEKLKEINNNLGQGFLYLKPSILKGDNNE